MVYPGQLKLEMRQRQLLDIYGNAVIYTGPNPLSLVQRPGTVSDVWIDYTLFVQGLDKMQLSWSTTQTPQGEVPEGQFIPKKGSSDTLTFERDAQSFLKRILIDDVAAPLNQVEVQLTDISGMVFYGYVIKATDLSWCEFNALCTFDLNIKQQDEWTQCIQRTMIADNHQGWFQPQPAETTRGSGVLKKHPRFSYCIEHRPNGMLVLGWYMLGMLGMFAIIVAAIIVVLDAIKLIVNAIISFIDFLGGHLDFLPITDPTGVFTSIAQLYIEAAGCGREHPAPLVRDYIQNVCDRCKISVDATTADIFFAPLLTVNTSDGSTTVKPNPHYNACLFFPAVKRGIRRYASINLFGTSVEDTTTYYEPLNQPVWALSDMLDHLKKVYNAQWRIMTDAAGVPHLHFHRKDWYKNQAPLYDFSIGGRDRHLLVEGICYEPTDFTAPASMSGLWQDDPADKCGHEASRQQNGVPLSFNNTINNPLFHGILDKTSGFGAAKFRLDGASGDYIYDAAQVLLNSAIIVLTIIPQMDEVLRFVRMYCDFALTLQTETTSFPKILIWDGEDNNTGNSNAGNPYLNARALIEKIRIGTNEFGPGTEYNLGKTAYPGVSGIVTTPDINPKYPAQVLVDALVLPTLIAPTTVPALLPWQYPNASPPLAPPGAVAYPPNTHIIGHGLSFVPPVAGKYQVQDYFGGVHSEQSATLVNYPMYFQPYYKDGLWDWFHWIDDPYAMPLLHKKWRLKIPLCKEDVELLAVNGDGNAAQLLQPILLDTDFYNIGVITEINLSWDTTGNSPGPGQYIELKGIV